MKAFPQTCSTTLDDASPHVRACQKVVSTLNAEFGAGLLGVFVAGSHARGEAGPGSDVDLLVTVRQQISQRRRRFIDGIEVDIFIDFVGYLLQALRVKMRWYQ